MTEMLHWYAETSGGVRQGDAPVHPGCGAVHRSEEHTSELQSQR